MGDKVREAAQALMDALDRTNWSSWQTTAGFSEQCGALRAALAAPPQEQAPGWMPIETAPRGSGEDGPRSVKDPGYVEPPHLLLFTSEGIVVGYYDWYYHEGYGRGAEPGVSAWLTTEGTQAYNPTYWQPLPAAPSQEQAKGRV